MAKTALITGSSTGIGAACVHRLAADGWRVYAGVRRLADGEQFTGDVVPVQLDVTSTDHVQSVAAQIRDEVGSLDGLINNAGVAVGGPIELVTDAEWRHQFDVNLFGLLAVTREVFDLVAAADGRFVHIGSISGRVSGPGLAPYTASKHALEAVNWSLRGELADTAMTSSIIEPGVVHTPIWDKAQTTVTELETRVEAAGKSDRYRSVMKTARNLGPEAGSKGVSPDRVAAVVAEALTTRRPRARYLVGTDARIGAALARLPDAVFTRVLALASR